MKARKVWDARFGFGIVVRETIVTIYVRFENCEYVRTYSKINGGDSALHDMGWVDIP